MQLPGMDSSMYTGMKGDVYAIAAKGETVVIAYFDDWGDSYIVKSTDNGFLIAEKDMQLRGFGDIGGFQQSGIKYFKLAEAIAGLNENTRDPLNGRIERDPESRIPSGVLREDAMALVESLIPNYTKEHPYSHVFFKLHIFNPEYFPYEKVCFVDSDLVPLNYYDSLFMLAN